MKCPTCPDAVLVMADRQGVEIDYCPSCRGIWLDRGELDKLLDKAAAMPAALSTALPQPAARQGSYRQPDFEDSDYRKQRQYGSRKKSWLNDIFD